MATETDLLDPKHVFKNSVGTQYICLSVYEMKWDEMFGDVLNSFSSNVIVPTNETEIGPDANKGLLESFWNGVKDITQAVETYVKKGDFIGNLDNVKAQSQIYLPLPNVLREVHHQIYEDSSYNMEDRFLRNGVSGIREAIKMFGGSKGASISEGIGSLVEALDHTMKRANITADTNNVLTYGGSSPRSHTFSFNLVPQNELEAQYYKLAIAKLKLYSLSMRQSLADPFNSKLAINVIRQSHLFTMSFLINEGGSFSDNKHLNTLFASDSTITNGFSLTNVTSTIGNGGLILFDGGAPKSITLSLTFTERKPLWYDELNTYYESKLSHTTKGKGKK